MSSESQEKGFALPPIPGGWEYRELGDLIEQDGLSYGVVQPGAEVDDGIPLVRVKNLRDGRIAAGDVIKISRTVEEKHQRTRLRGGEVLLSLVGSVGATAVVSADLAGWNVARAVAVIRPSDDVSSEWLRLGLSSNLAQFHMAMWQTNTVQATLNLRDVRRLPMVMPPKAEQIAITKLIGALDDKIAVNERIAATSLRLISAFFEWATREPGLTQKLANEVFDLDFGLPFASSHFNSDARGMPLLRIRDLRTFTPQVFTTQRLPKDVVVQPGEVVAGMDAEFRPSIWLGEPGLLNQRVLRCRSRIGGGNAFVCEALRRPLLEIEKAKTGTTVIHLNKSDLDRVKIAVPSPSALHAFEMKSEPLRVSVVNKARETKALAELRDALLPGLMSGAIRVRDAEKAVEDAT